VMCWAIVHTVRGLAASPHHAVTVKRDKGRRAVRVGHQKRLPSTVAVNCLHLPTYRMQSFHRNTRNEPHSRHRAHGIVGAVAI
jgi:hypothetical protein